MLHQYNQVIHVPNAILPCKSILQHTQLFLCLKWNYVWNSCIALFSCPFGWIFGNKNRPLCRHSTPTFYTYFLHSTPLLQAQPSCLTLPSHSYIQPSTTYSFGILEFTLLYFAVTFNPFQINSERPRLLSSMLPQKKHSVNFYWSKYLRSLSPLLTLSLSLISYKGQGYSGVQVSPQ